MKKFFYNIFLIKINFRKYGIKNISLIIFYELLYIIKLFDFSTNFYEKAISPKYKKLKNKKIYNAAYTPTPYYFLHLISRYTIKNKINLRSYYFIDFGCGTGRLLKFFYQKTKQFIGIDINNKFIKNLKNKYESEFFINADLRKYIKIIKKIKIKTKNNKKILYFYEPFEDSLVYNIIKSCLSSDDICIIVNTKNMKIYNSFNMLYKEVLGEKSKNILIIKSPK